MTEWADGPIHASGHPRQGEMARLYEWLRPKTVIPMHGEPRHLEAQVAFARANGLGALSAVRNGTIVRLLPGPAEIIGEAPVGRIYRDGQLLIPGDEDFIRERRKLSFVGSVVVSIAITEGGRTGRRSASGPHRHPQIRCRRRKLRAHRRKGRHRRHDRAFRARAGKIPDLVGEAVRKSVRAAINAAWGKKPICSVLVSVV